MITELLVSAIFINNIPIQETRFGSGTRLENTSIKISECKINYVRIDGNFNVYIRCEKQ